MTNLIGTQMKTLTTTIHGLCWRVLALSPLGVMIAVAMVGIPTAAQVTAGQNQLIIKTEKVFKLKTTQTIIEDGINDTGNPIEITLDDKAETKLDVKETLERESEENTVRKFSVQSNLSFEYGGAKGDVGATAEFEKTVRNYVKTGRETTTSASTSRGTTRKLVIAPGQRIFRARNTVSGGGFSYSYDTNIRMGKPPEETDVKVTIMSDLNPIFNALMDKVAEFAAGIRTDSGEWGLYSAICTESRIQGFSHYIGRVPSEIWTNGLDQDSWAAVKQAAAYASREYSQGHTGKALAYILLGFNNVRNPSHNDWAWSGLRDLGRQSMKDLSVTSHL